MDGLFPGMMIYKSCTAIMQVCEAPLVFPADTCHITHPISLPITDLSFAENAAPPKCTCAFHCIAYVSYTPAPYLGA